MSSFNDTPYIYQGEELGMTNAKYTSIEQYRDVESLNYYKILLESGKSEDEALKIIGERSRDNGRTPMQWSTEKFAGFSISEAWISSPDNYKHINVEVEVEFLQNARQIPQRKYHRAGRRHKIH